MVDVKAKETKPKVEILILYETPLKSWLVDASTFAMTGGMIWLGWFFDSAAMQWIAFVVFLIMTISVALGKSDKKCTIAEARERLNAIEKEMKG